MYRTWWSEFTVLNTLCTVWYHFTPAALFGKFLQLNSCVHVRFTTLNTIKLELSMVINFTPYWHLLNYHSTISVTSCCFSLFMWNKLGMGLRVGLILMSCCHHIIFSDNHRATDCSNYAAIKNPWPKSVSRSSKLTPCGSILLKYFRSLSFTTAARPLLCINLHD